MSTEIGQRIKALRISKGMTKEELGAVLGRSAADVETIEASGNPNLDTETIRLLCDTLDAFPIEFVYGAGRGLVEKAMSIAGIEGPHDHLAPLVENPAAFTSFVSQYLRLGKTGLLGSLQSINPDGLGRVRAYVEDLAKIDEYRGGL